MLMTNAMAKLRALASPDRLVVVKAEIAALRAETDSCMLAIDLFTTRAMELNARRAVLLDEWSGALDNLGREELVDLGRRLGKAMLGFTRTKQSEFAEAGLTPDSPESEVLDAVVATPILMQRPIVVRGNRATVGRPPEDILALLED